MTFWEWFDSELGGRKIRNERECGEQTRIEFWVDQARHFASLYREARSEAENFRRLYEAKTLELARAQKAAEDNEQRAN